MKLAELVTNLAPLRVLPSMDQALIAYEAQTVDPEARARLAGYRGTLRGVGQNGLLRARSAHRESSGRIRIDGPPLQQIANALRGHIAPSEAGRVFVDADYSAAHLRIAAMVTGDQGLLGALAKADPYAALAEAALPDMVDRSVARSAFKLASLALINGGGHAAVVKALGDTLVDPKATAAAIVAEWRRAYPVLDAYVVRVARREGLRELASRWSTVEARALDRVLTVVETKIAPLGGRVVLPMFDGLLVDAPKGTAAGVGSIVEAVMVAAMVDEGVASARVKVEIRERWGSTPARDHHPQFAAPYAGGAVGAP